ncbi:universal stress protein [Brachybacterium aquaticum]|uniref:Nucleotide-binding universal stress UspA family protein n=1 Tax=Brachybacterium aquaticum TaxID=1432564 RepID=A0A841AJ62_9MICO|nr:universal stress protein [Brachybacterium aquaticum]MBB5833064.1 nucleotide-binding universal stress UspA family protein [Brachybacterium aquaticum]
MSDNDTARSVPSADLGDRPLGVLVGYDGSDQAEQALVYAARAAQRAGSPLTVVTAYTVPTMDYAEAALTPVVPPEVARLNAARELLDQAREHLRGYSGQLDLRTEYGDAAGVLVGLSSQARLAVVGARGRGGFLGRLLGSVSSALPAHAHCPTVVVNRGYDVGEGADRFAPIEDDAPVIAGVDRSAHADLALAHAIEAAEGRGCPLHILMVMPPPDDWGGSYTAWLPDPAVLEQHRVTAERGLARVAEELSAAHPGLTITSEVIVADPAEELVKRSGGAQLTVLGTRGHGRLTSTLLGSVSRAVLQLAEGPVMVVPNLDPQRAHKDSQRPR